MATDLSIPHPDEISGVRGRRAYLLLSTAAKCSSAVIVVRVVCNTRIRMVEVK
jgi:hypothetical protein